MMNSAGMPSSTKPPTISMGLERCLASPPPELRSGKFGLLMNQASVDAQHRYACDLFAEWHHAELAAIFSPQHGIWGEQQANMIESPHSTHGQLELPIYSLYSEVRRPTEFMLNGLDCFVIDLQDVGTRVYTFIWTLLECLKACADAGISVVVLDRPNPLGGLVFEGPMLEDNFRSFVGGAPIPLRHGLTMAELARWFVAELRIDVELVCIPMEGWKRSMLFADTGRRWVWPSPNMPTIATTLLYPGQVLWEGTQVSEGRGTTRPFEVVGAPFLDPYRWCELLMPMDLPGVQIRPIYFKPTFEKWCSQRCGGLDIDLVDPTLVRSVQVATTLMLTAAQMAPEQFQWLEPPYEYETIKPPIDILFGSPRLRERIDQARRAPVEVSTVWDLLEFDVPAWQEQIRPYLLYT